MEFAINTDCRAIIRNFVQNGSVSFEAFCMQWKAMLFHHMYSAQSSTTEVLQTTLAMLHVTKRILCNEDGGDELIIQRIGALYLLYAIYFKQPTRQYVKINVTLQGWQQMRKFIDKLDSDNKDYDEARFIFWTLHKKHAFRFCAHDFHLGLENLVDYDIMMNKTGQENDSNQEQANVLLEDLMDFSDVGGMLPALTTLEDGYNEMKELLVTEQERCGTVMGTQVLPATNIFKNVQQAFSNIKDILGVQIGTKKVNEKVEEKVEEDQKNTRRNLKRKGYEVTQTKHGVKIEQSSNAKRSMLLSRGVTRMSSRTVFAEILPDETLQDLQAENVTDDTDDDDDDDDDDDVDDDQFDDISGQEEFLPN